MSSIEKAIERLAKSKVANAGVEATGKPVHSEEAAGGVIAHAQNRTTDKAQKPKHTTDVPTEQATQAAKRAENSKITLDYQALAELGYAVPDSENKQLLEEYRIIKRPVVMNAFGKGAAPIPHGNLVSIASSLPSEGKSFTALNLGLSIATEMDATVLLIDGDVIKASLSKLLKAESRRGLIDLLEDPNCAVGDVILDTQNPKLKMIPAGTSSAKSTELLASQAMERLLTELAERYQDRIIIFDSPPILATSEARVLNHLMGQVLLVVEAGQTPVGAVKDSLSRLDDEKAIGLVLNKSRSSKVGNYFGTYY
ncbi:MAG: XrtA-associated tyrosine autokinase [Candidatus Thiodiazotropha sp. (ex Monitilora ramsayi)]|nr:XrtA-associated tyrosine autokinase [Candidatus Thiodiazotropha sp. (ex Monitilora ramsayi)]